MVKITFIEPDGAERQVDAEPGCSVMEVAVGNHVNGIIAECGGVCSCATCRVYVNEAWFDKTGAPGEDEQGMIEFVEDMHPHVRLSCQIEVTEDLDGLVLRVAEKQR